MTYEQAYQILNVNKQSSTEEIKSAYKAAAKKYHPDLYKGDKKSCRRENEANQRSLFFA